MDNLTTGLTLMGVGMVMVFSILLIVIYASKALIHIVNHIAPSEETVHKTPAAKQNDIDQLTLDIIAATVAQVTGGKGVVGTVEKL